MSFVLTVWGQGSGKGGGGVSLAHLMPSHTCAPFPAQTTRSCAPILMHPYYPCSSNSQASHPSAASYGSWDHLQPGR